MATESPTRPPQVASLERSPVRSILPQEPPAGWLRRVRATFQTERFGNLVTHTEQQAPLMIFHQIATSLKPRWSRGPGPRAGSRNGKKTGAYGTRTRNLCRDRAGKYLSYSKNFIARGAFL